MRKRTGSAGAVPASSSVVSAQPLARRGRGNETKRAVLLPDTFASSMSMGQPSNSSSKALIPALVLAFPNCMPELAFGCLVSMTLKRTCLAENENRCVLYTDHFRHPKEERAEQIKRTRTTPHLCKPSFGAKKRTVAAPARCTATLTSVCSLFVRKPPTLCQRMRSNLETAKSISLSSSESPMEKNLPRWTPSPLNQSCNGFSSALRRVMASKCLASRPPWSTRPSPNSVLVPMLRFSMRRNRDK